MLILLLGGKEDVCGKHQLSPPTLSQAGPLSPSRCPQALAFPDQLYDAVFDGAQVTSKTPIRLYGGALLSEYCWGGPWGRRQAAGRPSGAEESTGVRARAPLPFFGQMLQPTPQPLMKLSAGDVLPSCGHWWNTPSGLELAVATICKERS